MQYNGFDAILCCSEYDGILDCLFLASSIFAFTTKYQNNEFLGSEVVNVPPLLVSICCCSLTCVQVDWLLAYSAENDISR